MDTLKYIIGDNNNNNNNDKKKKKKDIKRDNKSISIISFQLYI